MKKRVSAVTAMLLSAVLLLGAVVPAVAAETVTVDSVTAQLQAIDTLQQMQDCRYQYVATNSYDYTVLDNAALAENHLSTRERYETYLDTMFAARAAARQAYDSLSAEEQAQIDPALVAKLNNELPTVMKDKTYSVTPRYDEYCFEAVGGDLGLAYEVSHHMVAKEIPQTFIMVDTSDGKTTWKHNGKYEFGKSNYDVMYCCDVDTGVKWGSDYRRINLEDSPYFGEESAKHIRAIVQNSYPYVSLEQMKENMKADGLNAEFVDSLTRSDVISAVQMAIWQYNYDGNFDRPNYGYYASISIQKNTGVYFTPLHDHTNEIWEWMPGKKQRTFDARAEYRVNNLLHYLCTLESSEAAEDCIAISEVQVGRLDLIPRYEDVYSIGLHVLLNVGAEKEDDVTLKVVSYSEDEEGNVTETASTEMKVGKAKEYPITINARYGDTVKVSVEGSQMLNEGVYFYEAEGGPSVSQSMVGIAGGRNPVCAEQSFTFREDIEMGLRIYKKSSKDQSPISDITFHVYEVEPAEGENLSESPTAAEVAKYATAENLVGSVTTDVTGYAALELKKKGTYLVIEEHNKEKVEEPAAPFYITLPWPVETEVEGENGPEIVIEYQDVVSVYPKNTPVTPPPPPPPPPPERVNGLFEIIKHDRNDRDDLLAGAKFRVYRAATAEDTDAETLLCNGLNCAVVPVLVDGEELILTTDGDGRARSPELDCGVYYLKEIKAPIGYVLPKEAVSVTVQSKLIESVAYVYVGNDRGIVLPATGGAGAGMLIAVGGLLAMVAALFWITKKRLTTAR